MVADGDSKSYGYQHLALEDPSAAPESAVLGNDMETSKGANVMSCGEKRASSLDPESAGAEKESAPIEVKVYRRRWLMLAVFVLVFMTNAFQWIQFAIINNLVTKYYGVSSQKVDLTSLVFMVAYIPLIFPGAWIMDKWGLRVTLLLGSIGTTAGAWINVLSVSRDGFNIALIGQLLSATAQVFLLGVSPNVAAVWFGPDQVSSACSIGVFGSQLGIALGFLIPPRIVKDHEDVEQIGDDLRLLFYIVAGVCTTLLLCVLLVFKAKPPLPPSASAARALSSKRPTFQSYVLSIKNILTHKGYNLLLFTYGVNVGVFYAMSTLLNQTVLQHFPNKEEEAGAIGLTIVVCGMFGSILFGFILDRTHKFKETTLAAYILTLAGMLSYTFTFKLEYIAVMFVTAGATGFFMTGYLPVGFEFAAELTYPEPEVTSAGLLNASAQIFGILFTLLGGILLNDYGSIICNTTFCAALFVGAMVTLLIRPELKRQKANQADNESS